MLVYKCKLIFPQFHIRKRILTMNVATLSMLFYSRDIFAMGQSTGNTGLN
jgi:hypothetical protein